MCDAADCSRRRRRRLLFQKVLGIYRRYTCIHTSLPRPLIKTPLIQIFWNLIYFFYFLTIFCIFLNSFIPSLSLSGFEFF